MGPRRQINPETQERVETPDDNTVQNVRKCNDKTNFTSYYNLKQVCKMDKSDQEGDGEVRKNRVYTSII